MYYEDNVDLMNSLKETLVKTLEEIGKKNKEADELEENVQTRLANLNKLKQEVPKPVFIKEQIDILNTQKSVDRLRQEVVQLSMTLEQKLDRANNKITKDVRDFRNELETENPGCTYEVENRFIQEHTRRGKATRSGAASSSTAASATAQLRLANEMVERLKAAWDNDAGPSGIRSRSGSNASSSRNHLNVNRPGRKENGSFRPSPSVEPSPSPSTNRSTPAPVSPAVRGNAGQPPLQRFHLASGQAITIHSDLSNLPPYTGDFERTFDRGAQSQLATAGESRRGRQRKLTPAMQQMLKEQKQPRGQAQFSLASPLTTAQAYAPVPSGSRGADVRRFGAPAPAVANVKKAGRRRSQPEPEEEDEEDEEEDDLEAEDEEEEEGDATDPDDPNAVIEEEDELEEEEEEDSQDNVPYCLCRKPTFGDMIACDNKDCPIEWFHYECVGITETPTGKWYCPRCREGESSTLRAGPSTR